MKSDLDALMLAKNMEAILVFGNTTHNPPMFYLTGGGHVNEAILIKKSGEEAVLYCNDMEREEAEKSGLKVVTLGTYPWEAMLKEADGNVALTSATRLKRMLDECHITHGHVGIYGHTDVSSIFATLTNLQLIAPEIVIIGEPRDGSLFMYAMETKEESEVNRIRRMGRVTTRVVGQIAEYLINREVREDEALLKEDGTPLTVADVKSRIDLWLSENGAENPEGCIFAIGRDAGVPHSAGTSSDILRLGQTIVFDIFPCEAGGGYFYDFTRTWSLGYATPESQKLYEEVKVAFDRVKENLDLNATFKDYHQMVCELFKNNGHKTLLDTKSPLDGYVHSLGHGVGLNVHERPWSGFTAKNDNLLKSGVVFTIEPGLYYPEEGIGVRIEDTFWVAPDGKIEILAEYPYDFVLKMKKWNK